MSGAVFISAMLAFSCRFVYNEIIKYGNAVNGGTTMDVNENLSELLKKLGMDSSAVDNVMQQQPDLNALMQEAEAAESTELSENPALASIMDQMNAAVEQIVAQGGLGFMPGDMDSLMQQFGGMEGIRERLAELPGMDLELEEIDLDEEVAAYEPAAEDAADRKFLAALKAWIKTTLTEIPDKDVCACEIGFHVGFEDESLEHAVYDIWFAYNTERTNAANKEMYGSETWDFADWRKAQGYDEENDGDQMTQRIYDLTAVAVMELHQEHFTEQLFGRKIPFVIEDYEYYTMTAIRAVKANEGKELFDAAFFEECGVQPDEE